MDVSNSLPVAGVAGALAAVALKSPELLKEIYGDLAKPGVAQVGKAVGTVLGLGATILLPLRLLNETARAFEQRSFEQISERFRHIPIENVVTPPPEISIPIIEKLSQTQDDTLRRMFVELLAKASTNETASEVHPSFSQVLSSMAPGEAVLLDLFRMKRSNPIISVDLVNKDQNGKLVLHDLIMYPPAEFTNPEEIPLFLSNLSGLGIIEIHRDAHLTAEGAYNPVEEYAKALYNLPDQMDVKGEVRLVQYNRFYCNLSPYGVRMADACTEIAT